MHNKLSQKLMDAYMVGDQDEIRKIKAEIDSNYQKSLPKKKTNTIKINTVLNDDKSSAISVYDFLTEVFGNSWWKWEFETIERLLWLRYGVALEGVNRDKLWCIRHVCRSDGAFSDWFEFNQAALSFAGCIADFEYLRSPSAGMVINAVKALNHIRPDRKSDFSNDVRKYICIALQNEGIYTPPPSLLSLIKDDMKDITSPEVKSEWIGILKRYKSILQKDVKDVEENVTDIQAKRLLKAEASALVYGSR